MAKKKSKAKKSAPRKSVPAKKMCGWHSGMYFAKLSAMAFILFLIQVWPAAMNLVRSIHWGWFLVATVVFWFLAMRKHCW